jgi:hypothetical protein
MTPATLVFVYDFAKRAHPHAHTQRLYEFELHLGVQSRRHHIAAVAHQQRLVAQQHRMHDGSAERRILEIPGVMIVYRIGECVHVFGFDQKVIGEKRLPDRDRLV